MAANLNPRGMIFVGDHPTLLYTKYTSCGPHGFKINPHYKSMRAIDPKGHGTFSPKRLETAGFM